MHEQNGSMSILQTLEAIQNQHNKLHDSDTKRIDTWQNEHNARHDRDEKRRKWFIAISVSSIGACAALLGVCVTLIIHFW